MPDSTQDSGCVNIHLKQPRTQEQDVGIQSAHEMLYASGWNSVQENLCGVQVRSLAV